jgi:hypothetical protein
MSGEMPAHERWPQGTLISLAELKMWIGRGKRGFPAGSGSENITTGLYGGERGIRTLDRAFKPYNGLANRRLQPLGHLSGSGCGQYTRNASRQSGNRGARSLW